MNSYSIDVHKNLFDTPFHSSKPTAAYFSIAYLFQSELAARSCRILAIPIAAIQSPFLLQRDEYNLGFLLVITLRFSLPTTVVLLYLSLTKEGFTILKFFSSW
jgi:hypothetical protein